MKSLFRIAKAEFAEDLTGEGARRAGGRWTSKGVQVIHTAESAALAALEVLVHLVDATGTPEDLRLVEFELSPEAGDLEELEEGDLPEGWRGVPAPPSLSRFGDDWAARSSSIGLRVPSAVMPLGHQRNILINPLHPGFVRHFRIIRSTTFSFDPRIPLNQKRTKQ